MARIDDLMQKLDDDQTAVSNAEDDFDTQNLHNDDAANSTPQLDDAPDADNVEMVDDFFEKVEVAPQPQKLDTRTVKEVVVEEQKPYGKGSFYETELDFIAGRKNYTYYLSQFEGPLDLLYTMIKAKKINIEDFLLSEVTEQYIEIVSNSELSALDMDYAGDFITTMAELMYEKARRLLPVENAVFADPDEGKYTLQSRIMEYAVLTEAALELRPYETTNRYYREPVYTDKDYQLSIKNFNFDKLLKAFAVLITRLEKKETEEEPKFIERERVSVDDCIKNISIRLFSQKKARFFSLFDESFDRVDICNCFFAILELVKRQYLSLSQNEAFGDIELTLTDGVEAPLLDVKTDLDEGADNTNESGLKMVSLSALAAAEKADTNNNDNDGTEVD